ncbi:choline/carnitine/betaine transporter [Isoalcanivorax pacificus W11-5]|jgi:choline/glycine/proline betaine transport protein|uniref:Choline/carnitine/betaine transporter n=1 Tax=Isoalcanivorax pacificus W11-5 TaxID=391936 RepID=A0A0B4XL20_9GAMM|nr:BCCT family transporter [Isoalcanivorax pacificus]AJD47273.1 choline/carnitine/betaine transporter [Isoalcanivorax pacificus W11-5]
MKMPKLVVQPVVFSVSAVLIVVVVILSFFYAKAMGSAFTLAQSQFATYAGWFYIISVNIFLLFVLYLMFSRFGRIRLGGPDAQPEFSTRGWIAMLFSAGMGIGLVFYSVAEPISHFASPPQGMEGGTVEAAKRAMTITLFHWGFHAWALYAVIALALAFFAFNRGLPLTVRSAFYPLLGERVNGPIGHLIDILAVVATMFGLATSLGIGVEQINAGLNVLVGLPQNAWTQIALIAGITLIALWSVLNGLDAGVRRLSEINMGLAALLMLFVFLLGPSLFILNSVVQNLGAYLRELVELSTWTESYGDTRWQHQWTIFYWAWWIAWSPFVGMFIARISRGRTIREFLAAVLFVPMLMTTVWMTVFGGTALFEELFGAGGIVAAVDSDIATALYALLDRFPFANLTSAVAVMVVIAFFVTSSDSGSLVVDSITAGGKENTPAIQRIFWVVAEGAVAAALLLAGGLEALQAGAVLTGLPFAMVLLLICYSLHKGLSEEWRNMRGGGSEPEYLWQKGRLSRFNQRKDDENN